MNSTIIVQQNIGIPAGPLKLAKKKSVETGKKSVGAIIRPMPRETGKTGIVRLDAASPNTHKTHMSHHQLEDYVQWLRAKIEQDALDAHQAVERNVSPSPVSAPVGVAGAAVRRNSETTSNHEQAPLESGLANPVEHLEKPVVNVPIPTLKDWTSTVSTESVANDLAPPISTPSPSPATESERAKEYSAKSFQRVDGPHDGVARAYLKFNELWSALPPPPAEPVVENLSSTSLDEAIVGQKQDNEMPASSPVGPGGKGITKTDAERLIERISDAIASVMKADEPQLDEEKPGTMEPEVEVETCLAYESKPLVPDFDSEIAIAAGMTPVRLDSLVVEKTGAVSQVVTEVEEVGRSQVDQIFQAERSDLLAVSEPAALELNQDPQPAAPEVLNQSKQEIPTSVAAWDVEDFRWPVVTNRMIVSGGEALDQLSRSAFELLTATNQRLAVAGLGRSEGTTSIAISLARWAAACGKSVLLVDADLVSPGLTQQVGLSPELSWINAVNRSMPPAEVIVRSQQSNLCVMPVAQVDSRVTWPRFIYDNLGELIDGVRSHFDLVILDVGPANQLLAESSRSSLLVDATLMVHNGVNSSEFQKTKSRLEMFGLRKMMIAENRTPQIASNVA
ncbi:MAG: Mrp family chromosome partitioning ATPase [Mariniblastus sp.]|jgi:Mrp family chromosome partitioning ATPase